MPPCVGMERFEKAGWDPPRRFGGSESFQRPFRGRVLLFFGQSALTLLTMKFIEPIVALIAWVFTKIVEVITTRLYTSKIIFNTVWEDPAVDLQALDLSPEDVMVNISSAGDHTLEFAAHGA
jgi:hypothetical protein